MGPHKRPAAATHSGSVRLRSGHSVRERANFWTPAFAGVAPNPQISFAIATAVSAMRFEKPHSLSYQDSTRTKLPSITLV